MKVGGFLHFKISTSDVIDLHFDHSSKKQVSTGAELNVKGTVIFRIIMLLTGLLLDLRLLCFV